MPKYPVHSQELKAFLKTPMWRVIRNQLEEDRTEYRRLCSTLVSELEVRQFQGRCQALGQLLDGEGFGQFADDLIKKIELSEKPEN